MGYDSYRPTPRSEARSTAVPRSPADRHVPTTHSRDPRVRQGNTSRQRSDSPPSNLDGTKDVVDESDISKIVRSTAEAVYLRNSLMKDLDSFQSKLNQESQALEGALYLSNHKTYIEQLEQRRGKAEIRVKLARKKFNESEMSVDYQIDTATKMISSLARRTSDKSEEIMADLRRQLVQEKKDRQSEVTSLQSCMQKQEQAMNRMRSDLDALIKTPVLASPVEVPIFSKNEQEILNKKIEEISARTLQHKAELLEFGKGLSHITGDLEPLRKQASEQELEIARLDNVFTPKVAVETLSTRVEDIAKQVTKFVPADYIKQTQLKAYVDKFNEHEKNYADFKKLTNEALKTSMPNDYQNFKENIKSVFQNLATTSNRADNRIQKTEVEATLLNQRLGHGLALLSNQVNDVRARFDSVSKQIAGVEHGIAGLNSRYNNLSSDNLVKRMTAVVDARRTAVHDEVRKLSDRVNGLQDACMQLKIGHAKLATEKMDFQGTMSNNLTAWERTNNLIKNLEARQDELDHNYTGTRNDVSQAVAATTEQRSLIDKLKSDQKKLVHDHASFQTELSRIMTASEQPTDLIKKLEHDHIMFSGLFADVTKKLEDSTTISKEMGDHIDEAQQLIDGLQLRVSNLDATYRTTREEQDSNLTRAHKNILSVIDTRHGEIRREVTVTVEESRSLQQIEHENLVAHVTDAKDTLDKRLAEIEKAHGDSTLQGQNEPKEVTNEAPTRANNAPTRTQGVTTTRPHIPLYPANRSMSSSEAESAKPSVVSYQAGGVPLPGHKDADNYGNGIIDDTQEDVMSDTVSVRKLSLPSMEPTPRPDYYSRVKTGNAEDMDIVDLTSDDAQLESSSQLLAKFGAVKSSNNPPRPSSTKVSNPGSSLKSARNTIEKLKKPRKRQRDRQDSTPVPGGEKATPGSKKARR